MKHLWFFYFFFIGGFIASTESHCLQGFLKFNNDTCFEHNSNALPLLDLFNGRICQEIACTGYIKIIESYICLSPKNHDLKLMLYGDNNSTHDIPIKLDKDDTYTVKQLAVSEKHITLLIISGNSAYRMGFFISQLGFINPFKLYYLGSADSLVWQPLNDSDVYMKVINNEIINPTRWPHTSNEDKTYSPNLLFEQCTKWNDSRTFNSNLQTMPPPNPTHLSSINKETTFFVLLVILISGSILIIGYLKFRKTEPTSNETMQPNINRTDPNGIHVFSPPPSYHSPDTQRIDRMEADLAVIRNYIEIQQTQTNATNASGSHETEELVPLNSETTDSLAI